MATIRLQSPTVSGSWWRWNTANEMLSLRNFCWRQLYLRWQVKMLEGERRDDELNLPQTPSRKKPFKSYEEIRLDRIIHFWGAKIEPLVGRKQAAQRWRKLTQRNQSSQEVQRRRISYFPSKLSTLLTKFRLFSSNLTLIQKFRLGSQNCSPLLADGLPWIRHGVHREAWTPKCGREVLRWDPPPPVTGRRAN